MVIGIQSKYANIYSVIIFETTISYQLNFIMKSVIMSLIALKLFSLSLTNSISGRWESRSSTGAVTGIVFKDDSTFEGYINKKPFFSGTYSYNEHDSIVSFVDNGCTVDSLGVYKVKFFSNSVSMRLVAISDACTRRKPGAERLVLGRVKPF
jgi:hypothetical protein